MSLNKSAARRLSLLAGSSIAAAGLSFGIAMTPTAAFAANECGDPSANGAAADVLTCPPGAYPAGVDYSATSDGHLTVILRDRVDTGTSNTVGVGGIQLLGDTDENMTLLREDSVGVIGDPRIVNMGGRAVDVTTQGAGNVVVNLTDGDPTAGEATTPAASALAPMRLTGGADAIRAEAAGTGSVSVVIAATGTPSGASHPRAVITAGANVGSNGSGVLARSTSGAINVDTRGAQFSINGTNGGSAIDAVSTSGNVTITAGPAAGRVRGILAQTGGAGAISVTATDSTSASGAGALAGIDTVAGTGATTITLTGGGTISGGAAGAAIRSVSASTSATAAVNIQNTGATVSGRVDFTGVTAGGVTFNNTAGSWSASGASVFNGFNDTVTFSGSGGFSTAASTTIDLGAGADAMTVSGSGQFNLGANTILNLGAGADTLTMSGTGPVTLGAGSAINFGADNDTLTMSGAGVVTLGAGSTIGFGDGADTFNLTAPRILASGGVLDFGAGADTLNLSGVMAMNGLTVSGVETFNVSSLILMGGGLGAGDVLDFVTSDDLANDVLVMTGGTWNGAGARVLMDVRLDLPQEGCATLTGAADCLDLRGASSSGETVLTLNYIGDGPTLGAFNAAGITLVDMAGAGTSAQGHFVLDPDTEGYGVDPMFGGVLVRPGLFNYGIRYDPVNNRHVLASLPRSGVLEYVVLPGAAQSIWHMTSRTVTARQTELREGPEAAALWLRTAGEYTQRETATDFDSFGEAFSFDNGYKLYAGTIMGGADVLSGEGGGYEYVVGLQAGYVGSTFDLNDSDTTGRFSGATGGAYASLWSDWFFIDGTLNINGLTLDYDAPGLSSRTTTYLNSVGASFEAGARTRITESTFAEPLASASWVRTTFEEISLSGGEVQPDDAESARVGLGMRLGATLPGQTLSASYFVTGRGWYEFEGETGVTIHNPGEDLFLSDEFTGVFGEAEMGINVFNAANTLSGFAVTGVKWKDGYSALNLSLGVRMAW